MLTEGLRNGWDVFDGTGDMHEQVIEVQMHHIRRGFGLFVTPEGLGHLGGISRGGAIRFRDDALIVLRADQCGFRPFDFRQHVTDHVFGIIQPHRAHRAGYQREFIIQKRPWQIACDLRPEILQLPPRGRVKGLGLHASNTHHAQAIPHFSRRTRGKGHGQNSLGVYEPLIHHVGDAIGNGAGLTGARARQNAHRSARGGGRAALILIQQGQIRLTHRDTTP